MKKFFLLLLIICYSSSLPQATSEQTWGAWGGNCATAFVKAAIPTIIASGTPQMVLESLKKYSFIPQNRYSLLDRNGPVRDYKDAALKWSPLLLVLNSGEHKLFECAGLQTKASHKVSTTVAAGLTGLLLLDKAELINANTTENSARFLGFIGLLTHFMLNFHEERKAQNGVGILPEAVVNFSLFNNKFVDGIAYLFSFGTINSSSGAMRVGIKIPFTS